MSVTDPTAPRDKVKFFRARVAAGTYQPDVEAVAGAILYQWSAEVATYAWLESVDQEATEPEDSEDARSETSSL